MLHSANKHAVRWIFAVIWLKNVQSNMLLEVSVEQEKA